MLDHNIPNGIDPCTSDVALLRELYTLYDKEAVDTYSDVELTIMAEQIALF